MNNITKSYGSDENILSMYLREINRIPLLKRDEEDKLARLAREGDAEARNRIVTANLRFVVNVAKKYQNQGLPLSDLINEGNIGLMNAIERFDVDKGYHFISYAVWWIRQAILKAVCEKSRMIRLPLNRANELVQIEKVRKEMISQSGEEPTAEEIASQLGMNSEMVGDLIAVSQDLVSLETPVYSERDSSVLGEFIEDTGYQSPDESVLEGSLKDEINKILSKLSDKESQILQFRFGLNNKRPMSLKEIGDRYNLTKERIRQIEKKAISRLQSMETTATLQAYTA